MTAVVTTLPFFIAPVALLRKQCMLSSNEHRFVHVVNSLRRYWLRYSTGSNYFKAATEINDRALAKNEVSPDTFPLY
jgi:hypothetical protein